MNTTPDLSRLSFDISALHAAYQAGVRPADVVREAYRRIGAVADDGIFLHLKALEDLVAEAEALPPFDARSHPLWGIPFAIKDNIDLAGTPTTAACPAYAYDAKDDAFAVTALRSAGALAIGKTNLDQFATGLVGIRSPYPPPKNAVDPEIVPGGSSSGSAVAVAHGIVSFSLGTDTAGSGRVPAALNNIVGLKPTLGALSGTGVVPACRTLDTISIFALTVQDAWRAFQCAAKYDPADAFARPLRTPELCAPPSPVTIGVPNSETIAFFGDAIQAESFQAALNTLETLGARIVPMDFTPFYKIADMLYEGAWVAERMTVIEDLLKNNPDAVHPVTREVISAADRLSAADAFRGIYRLAELKRVAEPLLKSVDLLCVPTIPTFYSVADLEADPITPNSRLGTYTNFVNLMDLCAIAVPAEPRSDGRPGSITLLAPSGQDVLPAAVANALHRSTAPTLGATGHGLPSAEQLPAGPLGSEIEIAVVGAHMSGLPLNSDLTTRGGRFLSRTCTAAAYRLYALAGGPPARPGLLRAANGASIEVETWALPETAFGDFLRTVPAPLSIGAVRLADGREVKGFLVEAAGIDGADDITDHGGWRPFLAQAS
ncbi:MAG: allophanate hydrolase [Roseibium sp.]|nr:allophanate hydrolase [Roseibium sp.]